LPETPLACRSCGHAPIKTFLSLGKTPLADALVRAEALDEPEGHFPLDVAFCPECTLVQITEAVPPEQLFVDNYLYFSSFSDELLRHSRDHALRLIRDRKLDESSLVVELASNDGYLLQNFSRRGVPVLGIDPAPDQAAAANAAGIPTLAEFFGTELAERLVAEGRRADVIIANNVMAHVPDLNGFVEGMRVLLADDGVITIENPYVRDLLERCEFDTIYHEHHCYFSCTAVDQLMRRNGLFLNHVEYFPKLHGGTLRWHVGKTEAPSMAVRQYLRDEERLGLTQASYYGDFGRRVEDIRLRLLGLLQGLKEQGSTIAAYGAAAKGSTLLNYVGIGTELIDFVVDRNVHKQGLHMPGVHIPILSPSALQERRPDYVLLLAWNFRAEILRQQAEYTRNGGRFIVPVPEPVIL
jgi:SAM-dependent methyltransferase